MSGKTPTALKKVYQTWPYERDAAKAFDDNKSLLTPSYLAPNAPAADCQLHDKLEKYQRKRLRGKFGTTALLAICTNPYQASPPKSLSPSSPSRHTLSSTKRSLTNIPMHQKNFPRSLHFLSIRYSTNLGGSKHDPSIRRCTL
jgi:hypothetical protein